MEEDTNKRGVTPQPDKVDAARLTPRYELASQGNALQREELQKRIQKHGGEMIHAIREATLQKVVFGCEPKRSDHQQVTLPQAVRELQRVTGDYDLGEDYLKKVERGDIWLDPMRLEQIGEAYHMDPYDVAFLKELYGYNGMTELIVREMGGTIDATVCFQEAAPAEESSPRARRAAMLKQARCLFRIAAEHMREALMLDDSAESDEP